MKMKASRVVASDLAASHTKARRTRIVSCLCTLSAIVLSLMLARESVAHHSFAMYDMNKLFVLTGTVKEFQWTNPHALLWVTGSVDGGAAELWAIELPTSPGNLSRIGWTKHSLAAGDPVTVDINPLRDGSRGGSFKKVTLTNTGKVLDVSAFLYSDGGPGGGPSVVGDGSAGGVATSEAGTEAEGDSATAKCSLSGRRRAGSSNFGLGIILAALAVAVRRMARRRGERRRCAIDLDALPASSSFR
jgi:hypothetical protein